MFIATNFVNGQGGKIENSVFLRKIEQVSSWILKIGYITFQQDLRCFP